jgi:pilus assembly protein CpaB
LVLAVVAAGLAALLARGLVSTDDAPVQPKVVEAPTSEVLVASTNIVRGARISNADLRWQSWPASALGPTFITRQQKPDAVTALTGSLARDAIANGEPITEAKLIDIKTGGFMSALLSPGMRAVAVTISPETGAGGFILPNDHVDIIQTRHVEEEGAQRPKDTVQGEILLHNIRVLAIDQRFREENGEQVVIGKTATLELTPKQAETVTVAQAEGILTLSLRGLSDTVAVGGDEAVPEQGGITTIRVVRYGSEKSVRVR